LVIFIADAKLHLELQAPQLLVVAAHPRAIDDQLSFRVCTSSHFFFAESEGFTAL
jgi:hypothetical protein